MRWRAWLDENGPVALLGAITGVVAFTYLHVFAGEPCGDDNSFHYAEIARLAAAFGSGDLDAWNPGGNAGFASGYYYQVVAQAFPAALSALTGLSPLFCFQLAIFVPLVAAPALAFRALRVAGATPWQAVGGAIALPFAIGTSRWGHDGTFVVGLYTQLWAFVAFPLAFAHAARWVDEGRDLPSAIAWGLFCGLAHPFAGIALGLAVVAGMPIVLVRERKRPLLRLVLLGACLVVGSACAWLPVLVDYDGFGGFPHRVADEVGLGFEALYEAFKRGDFLDQPRPLLPVLTALLPVAAILGRASWMPRWWAAAAIFALLLGAGPHLPKVGDDDLLPAVRFWGSLQIVLALLAGAGVVAACERAFRARLGEPWQPMVDAATATACLLLAIFVVGTGLPVQRDRVRSADDFEHIHRRDLDPLLATLRALPPGRTQIRAGVANHWAVALPYVESHRPPFLVMGGAPLQSSSSYVFAWELRDHDPRRAAWIFDAPYVLALATRTGEVPGAELVATSGHYALMRYPAPGLVGPVQVTGALPPGREAARAEGVRWLWSAAPYEDRVLAYAGSGGEGPPPQGRVIGWRRGGSWIAADVEADAPTTFVVRETWHPRWRATLDGAAVPVRHVTPSFMAIDVPPGAHTIRLEFERPWWAMALWLLWPAMPLAAWLTRRPWARDRAAAA